MKDELFQELLESVREGGAILRGEQAPARRFKVTVPDVGRLRREAGFSQREFATLIGISAGTLRNWEQGLRQPTGPARVLLALADQHPKIVWETVRSQASTPAAGRIASKSASAKGAGTKKIRPGRSVGTAKARRPSRAKVKA